MRLKIASFAILILYSTLPLINGDAFHMSKLISSSSRKYLLCQVWLTFIQRLNIFKKLTDKRTDEWTTGDKKNQLKLSAQTSSELYKYYLQSKMIKVMLSHLMSNLLKSRLHESIIYITLRSRLRFYYDYDYLILSCRIFKHYLNSDINAFDFGI